MGGLLTLDAFTKVFPEIDTTARGTQGLTPSQKDHKSTIQGMCEKSRVLGMGLIILQVSLLQHTMWAASAAPLPVCG